MTESRNWPACSSGNDINHRIGNLRIAFDSKRIFTGRNPFVYQLFMSSFGAEVIQFQKEYYTFWHQLVLLNHGPYGSLGQAQLHPQLLQIRYQEPLILLATSRSDCIGIFFQSHRSNHILRISDGYGEPSFVEGAPALS